MFSIEWKDNFFLLLDVHNILVEDNNIHISGSNGFMHMRCLHAASIEAICMPAIIRFCMTRIQRIAVETILPFRNV